MKHRTSENNPQRTDDQKLHRLFTKMDKYNEKTFPVLQVENGKVKATAGADDSSHLLKLSI